MNTFQFVNRDDPSEIFWGEIAPCDHVVQIYEADEVFFATLTSFVAEGINSGDGVIVIATRPHLDELEAGLEARQTNHLDARERDQYIPVDAEEALEKFMVGSWPDEDRFKEFVAGLLCRARKDSGRVRAFGELVALLWARGHNGATVRLEHLWHQLCETDNFCLLCAYPRIGFTQDAEASVKELCAVHSKVLAG
ncbi:MAG TPA: MEDS domain-containing protein [Verrucomicrobiales bacterium]|nr:MEDS domain-containing protein [Verrucomicrobiales bacterium]